MPSQSCKPFEDFGIYSKIKSEQISKIKFAAKSLVAAHKAKNPVLWKQIIEEAYKSFSKHERGIMSGFALMMIEGRE